MAASSIFFNGRVISIPGSYSETDASGLEQVGLGASGIVAVLGTAEGGRPASTITEVKDLIRINKPSKSADKFRSGDLREVTDMLFAPSPDEAIPGGASEVVCMKVNPATQSTATLQNENGDSIVLTSRDYGAFTEQINANVQAGTNQGKLLTIKFEDTTESVDDLGGDVMFTLSYANPASGATGWPVTEATVIDGGSIQVEGRRAEDGLDTDFTGTQLVSNTTVEIVSDDAEDIGNSVTVWGLNAAGTPVKEVLTTNGTTAVVSTNTFSKIIGVKSEADGTVTLRVVGGGTVVTTIATDTSKGFVEARVMYVASAVVSLVADDGSTAAVVIEGKNTAGATVLEKITLTGTTPVSGTAKFTEITKVFLGLVAAATEVTVLADVAKAQANIQTTLTKAKDYFNARSVPDVGGFTFTLVTSQSTFLLEDLDVSTDVVDVQSPAEGEFLADTYAIVAWINQNSQLVEAEAADGAVGAGPAELASPLFLSGGDEGTTTFNHWQGALNLLKKTRVNSVVVLTPDPAVHAALAAHCAYMGGIGRSERDAFVGLMNEAGTDVASKDEIKEQITALNTRHVRAVAQTIERFNSAGERVEFAPHFHAALLAGAQAGTTVGEPLTFKYMNVLAFRQHASWNPTDDAEEMIQAGLCFLENIEGRGRRVVRNVTTHLSSRNLAYTEGSVNQAVNYATYNFRTEMEAVVGRKGFAGTVNAAKGTAVGVLGLLIDSGALIAWNKLDIELTLDVLEVSVEIAPVLPINFVKSTLHLVTVRQSAA